MIKTTSSSKKNRGFRLFASLLSLLVFAGHLKASTETALPRFSFSVSASFFRPGSEAYKNIYGQAQYPLTVQFGYAISRLLALQAGWRYIHSQGRAQSTGPSIIPEIVPVTLAMNSIFTGIQINLSRRTLSPFIGADIYYTVYRETWETPPTQFQNEKWGGGIRTGIEYRFKDWLSAAAFLRWTTIATGEGSMLETDVNLGGLELGLALGFHF